MKELGTVLTKNRIETACLLSEVYMQLKMYEPVKQILKEEVPYSREFHQFYAWLLFLLAVSLFDFTSFLAIYKIFTSRNY